LTSKKKTIGFLYNQHADSKPKINHLNPNYDH